MIVSTLMKLNTVTIFVDKSLHHIVHNINYKFSLKFNSYDHLIKQIL